MMNNKLSLPKVPWLSSLLLLFVLLLFQTDVWSQFYEFHPAQNCGGSQQFSDFIAGEMVYPVKALKERTQGTVAIKCIVTAQGEVQNKVVSRSVSPEIDAEAIRLFGYFLWDPSIYRGEPIDDEVEVEIDFRIRKYRRDIKKRGYETLEYPHQPVDSSMKVYPLTRLDTTPRPVYEDPKMKFANFVMDNLVYPEAALMQDISGTVELFFVVEPWGRISNVKVTRHVGGGCSEEAVRLLKLLKWSPGILQELAVRTEMTLSITFNLGNYENLQYVPASNTNQF
jgi:TonB family protein